MIFLSLEGVYRVDIRRAEVLEKHCHFLVMYLSQRQDRQKEESTTTNGFTVLATNVLRVHLAMFFLSGYVHVHVSHGAARVPLDQRVFCRGVLGKRVQFQLAIYAQRGLFKQVQSLNRTMKSNKQKRIVAPALHSTPLSCLVCIDPSPHLFIRRARSCDAFSSPDAYVASVFDPCKLQSRLFREYGLRPTAAVPSIAVSPRAPSNSQRIHIRFPQCVFLQQILLRLVTTQDIRRHMFLMDLVMFTSTRQTQSDRPGLVHGQSHVVDLSRVLSVFVEKRFWWRSKDLWDRHMDR